MFHLVLVTFSAILHILISEINFIMCQDYISRSFEPFPSSLSYFLVFTMNAIPIVNRAGNVYVFCACVTIKKGEDSNIY